MRPCRRWPLIALGLLCAPLLPLLPLRPGQAGPAAAATQARQAFASGNINAAIALWSQMISAGQDVQDSLYNRAQAYLVLNQLPSALNDLNQLELLQRPAVRSNTFIVRGIVFNEMRNYPAALRDFDLAERIDQNRLVYANRALTYQGLSRFAEAENDLLKAVRADPSQANLHNLAAIQLSLGKFHDCVSHSSRVVKTFRAFYPAYTVRGSCYYRLGQVDNAVADFLRSITLSPTQADANQYLGMALISLGKPEQARPYLLRAADLSLSQNDQPRYQEVMQILSSNPQSSMPQSSTPRGVPFTGPGPSSR